MKRKDLLKTIITDNQTRNIPPIWKRSLVIPFQTEKIITLSGVRRSGKTYHLLSVMQQLQKQGVPPEKMLYLNFEDERLDLDTAELDLILQSYRELYPDQDLSSCYFFFDEIQEVTGWEKFITRLYNTISTHIFITGSNARLLSREIATELRGRTLTYEVYPLSFSEYVRIRSPKLNPRSSQGKALLTSLFDQFLYQGGFPEVIHQTEELREKILQEYFNVMVLRDLIERYGISQAAILKYFCKRVVATSAGELSVNKIYNELKSQGYKISKDTLYDYQGYVEAVYLTRLVPKYAHSVVKSELSQKKSYVIDQGMGVALDYKLSQDRGRLLETTIALELIKAGQHITYSQNGSECDFIQIEKGRVVGALQVTQSLTDELTRARELKGLVHACQTFQIAEGTIVTLDEHEELNVDGINIHIVPAAAYCYILPN